MIVKAAHPSECSWIAERAKLTVSPNMKAIKAVDGRGRIAGMVAYDGWTPNSVCIHVALDSPLAIRSLLLPAFRIPFLEMGREVLLATILASNVKSMALALRLGFREAFRGRDWFTKGSDLVWLEMRRENCRWLEDPVDRKKVA